MFFIEEADGNESFVLFCKEKSDTYQNYLNELGGIYRPALKSQKGGDYEGWIFAGDKRAQVDAFIEEVYNAQENQSVNEEEDEQSMEEIYLLFQEIFERLDVLEKAVFKKRPKA